MIIWRGILLLLAPEVGKPCFGKVNMFRTVLLLISVMLQVVLSLSIACVGGLLDQALKSL